MQLDYYSLVTNLLSQKIIIMCVCVLQHFRISHNSWTMTLSLLYLFLWSLFHKIIEFFVLLFPYYLRSLFSTIICFILSVDSIYQFPALMPTGILYYFFHSYSVLGFHHNTCVLPPYYPLCWSAVGSYYGYLSCYHTFSYWLCKHPQEWQLSLNTHPSSLLPFFQFIPSVPLPSFLSLN